MKRYKLLSENTASVKDNITGDKRNKEKLINAY